MEEIETRERFLRDYEFPGRFRFTALKGRNTVGRTAVPFGVRIASLAS